MTSAHHTPVRVIARSMVATAQRAYRGEVVARHTATGETLLASDRPRSWWTEHGRDGTRSFACLDCLDAGDSEPWIHYAGGDVQRPHFRHFRRLADGSEPVHGGETSWHLEAKRVLSGWARSTAISSEQEVYVEAGSNGRRADVLVTGEGWRTALEAQHSFLGAPDWTARHTDYAEAGVTDIWFYAPINEPSLGEVRMSASNCALLNLEEREVGLLVVKAVGQPFEWWREDGDLTRYVDHLAEAGEQWTAVAFVPLDDCYLDAGRLVIPTTLLALGDTSALEAARTRRRQRDRELQELRRAARARAPETLRTLNAGNIDPFSPRPFCIVCGLPLDPDVYPAWDRHILC